MGDINLLPDWYTAGTRLKKLILRIMAAEAVIFLLTLLAFLLLDKYTYILEEQAYIYSQALRDARFNESDKIVSEISTLRIEIDTLSEIAAEYYNENIPVSYILLLAEALPNGVHIRQLDVDRQRGIITVYGTSEQNADVSELIVSLALTGTPGESVIVELVKANNGGTAFQLEIRVGDLYKN